MSFQNLLSAGGTEAGTLTSGVGDILSGVMKSRAYRKNAKAELEEGRLRASERIAQGEAQAGRQMTQIAKSGFVIGESPMQFVEETSRFAEEDAMMILRGATGRAAEMKGAGMRSLFSGVSNALSRGAEYFQDERLKSAKDRTKRTMRPASNIITNNRV